MDQTLMLQIISIDQRLDYMISMDPKRVFTKFKFLIKTHRNRHREVHLWYSNSQSDMHTWLSPTASTRANGMRKRTFPQRPGVGQCDFSSIIIHPHYASITLQLNKKRWTVRSLHQWAWTHAHSQSPKWMLQPETLWGQSVLGTEDTSPWTERIGVHIEDSWEDDLL